MQFYCFFNLDSRLSVCVVKATFLRGRGVDGKVPMPIVQETGCERGPFWRDVENLASTGIWSPDRLTPSESLLQLCTVPDVLFDCK